MAAGRRGGIPWLTLLLTGALVTALLAGCTKGPEADSGPDGYRHQAIDIPLGQPVPDEFSWPGHDRSDWKRFVLEDDGLLTVNVHFSNPKAAARVELFDTYGKVVAKRLKEYEKDEHLQFTEELRAGRYFLRVMADDEGDASEYTVLLDFDG